MIFLPCTDSMVSPSACPLAWSEQANRNSVSLRVVSGMTAGSVVVDSIRINLGRAFPVINFRTFQLMDCDQRVKVGLVRTDDGIERRYLIFEDILIAGGRIQQQGYALPC